jgi:cyclin H
MAAWYLSSEDLVLSYIDWKYEGDEPMEEDNGESPFGSAKDRLLEIIKEVAEIIESAGEVDIKKVKEVDKRLKGCTNPEKVPGSALFVNPSHYG